MDDEEYTLLVSFKGLEFHPDSEHAFVHGVEFGQLMQRMEHGSEAEIAATIHEQNVVVVERAAAALGWDCEVKPTNPPTDGWKIAELVKHRSAGGNPHGLRVV